MLKMSDLDLNGKRVLIRVDLNVPIKDGKVTSIKRIEAILPTLKLAQKQNAEIILMSHLGRPTEGTLDPNLSLAPVGECLSQLLKQDVQFVPDLESIQTTPKQISLLENTRFLVGEKQNDPALSQKLAKLCDVFVMDAFATAHRKEASTYGVAEYANVACAGPLLLSEIEALKIIMKKPRRPLVAIVGGAKVSTKLSILKNILEVVDCLIVGGGIANTFLVAADYEVGASLYEPNLVPEAKRLLDYAKKTDKLIPIPDDVIVAKEFSADAKAFKRNIVTIDPAEMIMDIGPQTMQRINSIIANAKTILWNGPLGVFEWDQFGDGTASLAKAIAKSKAYSVAGGGDTLAAIEKYKVENGISYISTGGGAFLEFLEGKNLPAIQILEKKDSAVSH